jgi:hypothetical protein
MENALREAMQQFNLQKAQLLAIQEKSYNSMVRFCKFYSTSQDAMHCGIGALIFLIESKRRPYTLRLRLLQKVSSGESNLKSAKL